MSNESVLKKDVFKYIIKMIKPFYFHILYVIFLTFVDAGFTSLNPYLTKMIINKVSVLNASNDDLIKTLLPLIFFYIAIQIILELSWRLYSYVFSIKTIPKLRNNILNYNIDKILDKNLNFYLNNSSGKLSHNLLRLTKTIPEIIELCFNKFLIIIFTLLISFFTLAKVNFQFPIGTVEKWVCRRSRQAHMTFFR